MAGRERAPRRPTWRTLAVSVSGVMALWAAGVVALPDAWRRPVDLVGGIAVLVILVVWLRCNGTALAYEAEPPAHDQLAVRVVRSRRPPLPEIGGPEFHLSRRGGARHRRQGS